MDVAGGNGFRHHAGGVGFGLGQTFACFGIAERRFALAFRFQNGGLLGAFRAKDLGVAGAFCFQHLRALFALRLHLPRHGIDEVLRRRDILDFDTGDLDAPGAYCLIDHAQQAVIDGVAV
ncbi:hypothetical protein D3C78_839400 [compost metagenome]